jgi:exodeoxyribonuclease VII small subunit
MKPISAKSPASFEVALQELEVIVQTLEGGGASIEDSLKAYERGMKLRNYCQETLGQAEQKIRILENGTLRDCSDKPSSVNEGDAS